VLLNFLHLNCQHKSPSNEPSIKLHLKLQIINLKTVKTSSTLGRNWDFPIPPISGSVL